MEYFKQKIVAGEVGSSAMPHKVNPSLGRLGATEEPKVWGNIGPQKAMEKYGKIMKNLGKIGSVHNVLGLRQKQEN